MNSSKFLRGLFRNYILFVVVKNFDSQKCEHQLKVEFNKFHGLKFRFEFELNVVDAN